MHKPPVIIKPSRTGKAGAIKHATTPEWRKAHHRVRRMEEFSAEELAKIQEKLQTWVNQTSQALPFYAPRDSW